MNAKLAAVIEKLKNGETIENFKEGGNSMTPLIKSRQPVTLAPVDTTLLEKGDIVLTKVNGKYYTHLISALRKNEAQISNNHNFVNGWTKLDNIFGIVTAVDGKEIGSATKKVKKFYQELPTEEHHIWCNIGTGSIKECKQCIEFFEKYPYESGEEIHLAEKYFSDAIRKT